MAWGENWDEAFGSSAVGGEGEEDRGGLRWERGLPG